MKTPRQKRRLVLGSILLLAIVAALVFLSAPPASNKLFLTPPHPNGYPELLRAGKMLPGKIPNLSDSSPEEVESFVAENQPALDMLRSALSRPGVIEHEFTPAYLGNHVNDLADLKKASRFLSAIGHLAEQRGDLMNAMQANLDLIRLGSASARGGLVIDALVRTAILAQGMNHLKRMAPRLDHAACDRIMTALEEAEQKWEPFEIIQRRELAFFRRSHGWWYVFAGRLAMKLGRSPNSPDKAVAGTVTQGQALIRLGWTTLALRKHYLQHGAYPRSLSELGSPENRPLLGDPFRQRSFVYLPTETDYTLYSVGPDGQDDGAAVLTRDGKGGGKTGDLQLATE